MYGQLSVAVVVPAYNEIDKIGRTIASVPRFVDRIIVVDDGSIDGTGEAARRSGRALELGTDAACVMAGDAQMDPADLPALLDPLAAGAADYAKGNRFLWPGGVAGVMPPIRLVGNFVLSWLTRLASGYWHLFDSQCGYTAITREALAALDLGRIFPRYGYPNDILSRLACVGARVVDVPVRPVYGPGWRSGIRPWTVVYPISFVLARALGRRLTRRFLGAHRRS